MSNKKFLLVLMLMASFLFTQAQTSVNSAGGDVSNASGSISLSVGQTSYTAIEDPASLASRIDGVQIPFEYYLNYCPADINQDGVVDVLDFIDFNSVFASTCSCREDIDRNGVVDVLDFLVFNAAFGSLCPASP